MSHSLARSGAAAVVSLFAAVGLVLTAASPALAQPPVTVSDETSLRAAITAQADSIVVAADITLTETLPTVSFATVIDGGGHTLRVDPSPAVRVLPILFVDAQGVGVTIRDLTLEGKPSAQGSTSAGSNEIATYGAYVKATGGGTVSLTNVSVLLRTEAIAGIGVFVGRDSEVDIDGGTIDMTRPVADGNSPAAGVEVRDQGSAANARVTISRVALLGTADPTGVANKDSGIFSSIRGTSLEVTDVSITGSSFGVLGELSGRSSGTFTSTTVDGCSLGGINLKLSETATASIKDSTIQGTSRVLSNSSLDAGYGVRVAATASTHAYIERTTIAHNAGVGLLGRLDGSTVLEVTDTTLASNGSAGANLFATGGSTTLITRTTSSANTGAGLWFHAASGAPTLSVVNSTVSGTTAGAVDGVAVLVAAPPGSGASTSIRHSTITANSGVGALRFDGIAALVDHTIVSGNTTSPQFGDVSLSNGARVTGGWNLIGTVGTDSSTPSPASALAWHSTRVGVLDPGLAPLADNGGHTWTHAVLTGSKALDSGDPNLTVRPDTDQRGANRVQGWRIDIGAYESDEFTPISGDGPPPGTTTRLASTGLTVDLSGSWVGAVVLLALGSALIAARRPRGDSKRR